MKNHIDSSRLSSELLADRPRINRWASPFKVAATYAMVAWLWIVLSDRILLFFVSHPEKITWLQTFKGGVFVAATAIMLAWLVRRDQDALHKEINSCQIIQENFRALVETIPHGIQECNVAGVITFTNKAYDRIFGLQRGEAVGTTIWDKYSHEEGREGLKNYILTLAQEQPEPTPYFAKNLTSDGRQIDIQVDWNYLRNSKGEVIGFASVVTDITERLRAEEVIRTSDRLKTDLITTAAHEFRTPLTTIQGYTELLLSDLPVSEEDRNEYLGSIFRKAVNLSDMVDKLLDLARVEAGQSLPMKMESCSISELLKEIKPYLKILEVRHNIEVTLKDEGSCLQIDRGRIGQVLENLLSNAAKYSEQGSLIRLCGELNGDRYRFSIIDQGIGMSDEQVERIFERFYRVDTSDTGPAGLGVGMAIVKQIAEAHGSTVEITSSPGQGTTASFELPLAD